MPLRAIIVDDEPLSRRALRQLLDARADVQVVAEYSDAVDLLPLTHDADLVFLDIEMPERSGLDAAREWPPDGPAVVFVTAFDAYAPTAFDTEAVDYLMKPVTSERLDRAIARVIKSRQAAPTVQRLLVRVGDRERFLDLTSVEAIEADGVYAAVLTGGRRHLIRRSLDSLADALPPPVFLRVHRSWIVRVGAVTRVERLYQTRTHQLVLRSGETVPISRRRQANVLRALRER